MLVLRRKVGDAITINQDIVITVLAVEGDRVKIGIEAPRDMSIVRSELLHPLIFVGDSNAKE